MLFHHARVRIPIIWIIDKPLAQCNNHYVLLHCKLDIIISKRKNITACKEKYYNLAFSTHCTTTI